MKCPTCEVELQKGRIDAVEVDECPQCNGVWFDGGELREAKDQTDPDLAWMDFELWMHQDRFKVEEKEKNCPKCEVGMVTVDYNDTKVEIDHCILCEGVWLDGGEFQKIIDSLTEELLEKDLPGYIKASLEEAVEILTGPERMLSEWRDFRTVLRMLQYRVLTGNVALTKALADIQRGSPFK
jgi:Zn-finger nucleic acid-binding protein